MEPNYNSPVKPANTKFSMEKQMRNQVTNIAINIIAMANTMAIVAMIIIRTRGQRMN